MMEAEISSWTLEVAPGREDEARRFLELHGMPAPACASPGTSFPTDGVRSVAGALPGCDLCDASCERALPADLESFASGMCVAGAATLHIVELGLWLRVSASEDGCTSDALFPAVDTGEDPFSHLAPAGEIAAWAESGRRTESDLSDLLELAGVSRRPCAGLGPRMPWEKERPGAAGAAKTPTLPRPETGRSR